MAIDITKTTLLQELTAARKEHGRKLKQVREARLELEKLSQKLRRLELRMTELEKQVGAAGRLNVNQPALLIVNPHSGITANGGGQLKGIIAQLRAHGIET